MYWGTASTSALLTKLNTAQQNYKICTTMNNIPFIIFRFPEIFYEAKKLSGNQSLTHARGNYFKSVAEIVKSRIMECQKNLPQFFRPQQLMFVVFFLPSICFVVHFSKLIFFLLLHWFCNFQKIFLLLSLHRFVMDRRKFAKPNPDLCFGNFCKFFTNIQASKPVFWNLNSNIIRLQVILNLRGG